MTPPTTPAPSFLDLPVEDKRLVDRVCLDFERAGPSARIEDHLARVSPHVRVALLAELVALELELRRLAGEAPTADEYMTRFSDMPHAVRVAFRQAVGPEVGGTLGRYRLTGVLGRGGMGVVYAAEDPVIDRKVAVKVLNDRLLAQPQAHEKLLSEARLAGQLLHPNVVALFEVGTADCTTFLVMELVTGGSAADRLKQAGALDWRRATAVAADVCRGLAAIHTAGFLHLDIKPANVLLPDTRADVTGSSRERQVLAKLSDFGLSMTVTAAGLGTPAGTPAYMSPEQRTSGTVSPQTDVFGLGATFFALLTGRAPFPGTTITEIVSEQLRSPDPDPRALNPFVPKPVARIVRRAMAPRPEDRYPSAAAMLDDLEAALAPPRPHLVWRAVGVVVAAAALLGVSWGIAVLLVNWGVGSAERPRAVTPRPQIDAWEPLLDTEEHLAGWRQVVADGVTPIGKGPPSKFELIEVDGGPALRASGTGQNALESDKEYSNFHLRFEYRWATAADDHFASVRYHCTGPLGALGTHGMILHHRRAGGYLVLSEKLQVDIGEIRGAGVVPVRAAKQKMDPPIVKEAPVARWTKVSLVCVNDWSIHAINGAPVLILAKSRRAEDQQPLTAGRIRFQSAKGEIFFRKIEIKKVTEVPPEFRTDAPGQ